MPTWKRVIVSGSAAHLTSVTASGILIGPVGGISQSIAPGFSGTVLSGSFSGSFQGSIVGSITTAITASVTSVADTPTTNGTYFVTFKEATTGHPIDRVDSSAFTYNPSTDTLSVGNIAATGSTFNLAATATSINVGGTTSTVAILGNLEVRGTTTTVSSSNLLVADRFILLASGSTTNTDGGIIVQNAANSTGSAFYYDGTDQRWSVNPAVGSTDTAAAANSYMVTVSGSNADPSGNPLYGAANGSRIGAMYVNTTTEDIWIWS